MSGFEFLALSGAIAWLHVGWQCIQGARGLVRRLKWAIWPNPRGRSVLHKASGSPYSRVAASDSWGGHSATRWDSVRHGDNRRNDVWEA